MKKFRSLFLIACPLLVGIILFSLRQGGERPPLQSAPGPLQTNDSPIAEVSEILPDTRRSNSIAEDDPIARALSADADDASATESQRRAFAALQKRLASPSKESLLEKIKRDPASYHISGGANGGKTAHNPIHGLAATFDAAGGIEVRSTAGGDWSWRMEALDLAEAGPLSSEGARVERRRGLGITEWYVNEERGLEQFFTLGEPIAQDDAGESRIRVSMKTALEPELESDDQVIFRDADGNEVLYYHGLAVFDVNETPLPARLELESASSGETIVALVFDATNAQFPVTVDPFVSTVLERFEENNSSHPGEFAVVDGSTFVFSADDGIHGEELWKSDGTAAGTMMVKNIAPDGEDSKPMHFTVAGSMILFSADIRDTGRELWKTDLSEAGTELVLDIDPGSGDGITRSAGIFNVLGSRVIFPAENDTYGLEMWASNGTPGGTGMLKNINAGSSSSYPSGFTHFNGELFFQADDTTHGDELWKTDGTPGGTVLVVDINDVGSAYSRPSHLTPFNGALYFSAVTAGGEELWKSDGVVGGTTERVKDVNPGVDGSSPDNLTVFNGSLLFTASDDTNGNELWISDGTENGTELLKDITPEIDGSDIRYLTAANGTLFFRATDGTHGSELWKTDGTAVGTVLVADINPGSEGSNLNHLFPDGSNVYFSADDGTTGGELWMSDGTTPGTMLLKEINSRIDDGYAEDSSPRYFFAFNGDVLFQASDADGSELWTTDGTEVGTVRFKDINRTGELESDPVKSGDRIFFAWDTDDDGVQLWSSDGTPEGTGPLIPSGHDGDLDPEFLTDFDGTLFFQVYDEDHGRELWKSNGTSAGTTLVKDIAPLDGDSSPEYFTPAGNTLFFSAWDDTHGRELWKSDGTAAGTVLVKDIRPGTSYSDPEELANLDGTLLFRADDGSDGEELWKSDGTEAGTVLVKNIFPGNDSSSIEKAVVAAEFGLYFFSADDGTNGQELWESDGTETGTRMVKDIEPGPDGSHPDQLTDGGGVLYFEAFTSAEGRELWYSESFDSGSDGTQIVQDIGPGTADGQISQITPLPGFSGPDNERTTAGIVFLADDGTNGLELWIAQGENATLLVDLAPGAPSGFTADASFAVLEIESVLPPDILFFPANDGTTGTEIYSPPTGAAPTVPVLQEDTFPGGEGSNPIGLIDLNGQLIWFASDDQGGYTLRTESGDVLPDCTVGKNLGNLKGNDIYNTSASGQKLTLVSKKLKKLKFHGKLENDGDVADRVSMTGTRGNNKFKVNYFGPTGNVTGQVTGAGYELTVPPGDSKIYRVEIKPKSKLKKKKTGKIKRKTRTLNLTSKSTIDPAQSDKVQCKGKTR